MKRMAIVIGFVLLFLSSTTSASGPARMVLVLDGSGSMWGQIDGQAKIAIAEKGSKDLRYKDYTYTKKGNPAAFLAPGDVGDYEMRYVHAHTRKVIGRADIKVTPVKAAVQAPASADGVVEFEVVWQGPAYPSDYISVAHPEQGPGSYVNDTYTFEGSPLKVRAPSDPGCYEVRYIMGRGNKLLAKTSIKIIP